jgi:hypothetical protein
MGRTLEQEEVHIAYSGRPQFMARKGGFHV